ncbi:MAG: uroporphyrinogen-III synthase [Planctomycetes bacterium]|nr:uroporphyrinogen-III synthase [Planctomycetota bacterium]
MGTEGATRGALQGRRVVVTRPRAQAEGMTRLLEGAGATVIPFPAIRVRFLEDPRGLDEALGRLDSYRWVCFTSANGVEAFCARLRTLGIGEGRLRGVALAAIGPGTERALRARGLDCQRVARRHVAEGLLEALAEEGGLAGARVLLPRALEARDALPRGLASLGAQVDVIPVYETVTETGPGGAEELAGADAITFTAPSTVRGFLHRLGGPAREVASRACLASIGPVTSEALRRAGLRVGVEAAVHTAPGLVRALSEALGHAGPRDAAEGRGVGHAP